jgi:hypothetical protein
MRLASNATATWVEAGSSHAVGFSYQCYVKSKRTRLVPPSEAHYHSPLINDLAVPPGTNTLTASPHVLVFYLSDEIIVDG